MTMGTTRLWALLLSLAALAEAGSVPESVINESDFALLAYTGCTGSSYNRTFVDDGGECVGLCRDDAKCGAFSVNLRNLRCYLKESCGETEAKTDNFSGIKMTAEEQLAGALVLEEEEEEREEPGLAAGDEPSYTLLLNLGCKDESYSREGGMDEPACRAACTSDPRCGAYTLNKARRRCYLKEVCNTAQNKTDNVSGVKSGTPLPSVIVSGVPPALPSPPPIERTDSSVFYGYPAFYCDAPTLESRPARTARGCRVRCEALGACLAYSYNVVSKACELKEACREMLPNAPWFTGFLVPYPGSWYP